jgi:hypothetical protein
MYNKFYRLFWKFSLSMHKCKIYIYKNKWINENRKPHPPTPSPSGEGEFV